MINPTCANGCKNIEGQRTKPLEGSLIIFPHLRTGELEIAVPQLPLYRLLLLNSRSNNSPNG